MKDNLITLDELIFTLDSWRRSVPPFEKFECKVDIKLDNGFEYKFKIGKPYDMKTDESKCRSARGD